MILVAAVLAGLGLVSVLCRQSMLGMLVGLQLLVMGATLILVMAGVTSGVQGQGHLFGLFVALSGVGQLVVGYALAVRLFYLKKRASMDELRALKH